MRDKNATFHIKEEDGNDNDDVLLEVKRMRNSLNALAMKNIMFESKGGYEEIVSMEIKNISDENSPPPLPVSEPPTPLPLPLPTAEPAFKRTYSGRHSRVDSTRAYSMKIDQEDVLKALIIEGSKQANAVSAENIDEKPKARVHFVEEDDAQKTLKNNPSRESDEVATINEMPWKKKHEFRIVTPFFKPKTRDQIEALDREHETPKSITENISLGFRPIERNRTKELDASIIRPVPLLTSKSYQELPRKYVETDFKKCDKLTKTKSNDDLLLDNIDGAHKFTESKTHRLMRMRSISNNALNQTSEQSVYENFEFQSQTSIDESIVRKARKPMPQPRTSFQDDKRTSSKRTSKTIVYVLDKSKDEFVLQDPDLMEEEYENVLIRNEVDQYRDSAYFNALLNSREDCESSFDFYRIVCQLQIVIHLRKCCHHEKFHKYVEVFFLSSLFLSMKLFQKAFYC